jgi:hypothetical protein
VYFIQLSMCMKNGHILCPNWLSGHRKSRFSDGLGGRTYIVPPPEPLPAGLKYGPCISKQAIYGKKMSQKGNKRR